MQTFLNGDLVKIADDLGDSMRHFRAGCEAVVIGSYIELVGGRFNYAAPGFNGPDNESYSVFIEGAGPVAWYIGRQLTLIEHGRHDLIMKWQKARPIG